ncbi:tyrosine-type recombinase/integrase [Bifidobacterium moukalabense]|uniref:tyrosine-type recombinase/integrase n=1 Tax=Bifidobacterium moukalabense TaxID=1333651 RepID=UPI00135BDBEE|nr:site-specific integrase [Bifidobacterium moukalabense]
METLSDMVAGWLAGVSRSSRASYRSVLSRWLRWCADNGIDVLHARRRHIEVFASVGADMEPSGKRTIRSRLGIIGSFYRYLFEEGYIGENPAEHVRGPRIYGHADGSYLTREQAVAFLGEARGMDAQTDALCRLLLLTGARAGEALGLDVADCHTDDVPPWVRFDRKGDWMQRVAIPDDVAEALERHLGRRRKGPVFLGRTGKRMTQQALTGIVSSVALRIGVPDITPHSLRRTFCTLSRDAGIPDRDVMAAGGWNSPRMLDYYDMARRGLNGAAGNGLRDFLQADRED